MNGIYLSSKEKVLSAMWDGVAYFVYMAILGVILYGCVVGAFYLMNSTSDMAGLNFILLVLLGIIVFKHAVRVTMDAYWVWHRRIKFDDNWDYF